MELVEVARLGRRDRVRAAASPASISSCAPPPAVVSSTLRDGRPRRRTRARAGCAPGRRRSARARTGRADRARGRRARGPRAGRGRARRPRTVARPELASPSTHTRQRRLTAGASSSRVQRAGRELGTPARADRPDRGRVRGGHPPPRRADAARRTGRGRATRAFAGGRSSRIRRSSSSAASSSEPAPPFDALGRAERRLDRRPQPLGTEVRAQSRAQVARAPDVQHLVVAVAEEIDARALTARRGEQPLVPTRAGCVSRRGPDEVGDGLAPRSCASPISVGRISAVACASGSAR